ncbi:MAG: SBBP repeat-containing protein [Gemmataceae bacterium]
MLKLNADGSFAWVRQLGGAGRDLGGGVAVDAGGGAAVAVDSGCTWLATTPAAARLWWHKMSASPAAVALDGAGNAHFAEGFSSRWTSTPGPALRPAGKRRPEQLGGERFVLKLTPAGSAGLGQELRGGLPRRGSSAYDIAVDGSGNVYTAGDAVGGTADYDPGKGKYLLTGHFLSSSASGLFVWAREVGAHPQAGPRRRRRRLPHRPLPGGEARSARSR